MKLNLILHIIKKLLKDKMTSEVAYFYNEESLIMYLFGFYFCKTLTFLVVI